MKIGIILSFFLSVSAFAFKAPMFSLTNQNGKKVTLESLKGKTVIMEWYNDGCPFVRKHYDSKNMQNLQKKYKDKVVWVTVSSSAQGKQGHIADASAAQKLIKKEGAHMQHLLLDTNGEIGQLYAAKTTPQMFIIDPTGMVVYNGAIDSISSADKEDVAKAKNYVDLAMADIAAGKPVKISRTKPYGCSVKY